MVQLIVSSLRVSCACLSACLSELPSTSGLRASVIVHGIVPTLLALSCGLKPLVLLLLLLHLVMGLGNSRLKDAGVSKINYAAPVSKSRSSSCG